MSDFFEKNLEDIIYDNKRRMWERGLEIRHQHMVRQLELPIGKIIDLLSYDIKEESIECTVFELKREKLNIAALRQLGEYAVHLRLCLEPYFSHTRISKVLIGNHCELELKLLNHEISMSEIYTYEYRIDGIWFNKIPKTSAMAGTETGYNIFHPRAKSEDLVHKLLQHAGIY